MGVWKPRKALMDAAILPYDVPTVEYTPISTIRASGSGVELQTTS